MSFRSRSIGVMLSTAAGKSLFCKRSHAPLQEVCTCVILFDVHLSCCHDNSAIHQTNSLAICASIFLLHSNESGKRGITQVTMIAFRSIFSVEANVSYLHDQQFNVNCSKDRVITGTKQLRLQQTCSLALFIGETLSALT